jgi:hypothetical protein
LAKSVVGNFVYKRV